MDDFSTPEDIERMFLENLVVLNEAFAQTPFYFTLQKTTQTARLDWTQQVDEVFQDMGRELGSDNPVELDVFLAVELTQTGRQFLGMASNAAAQTWQNGDGVFLRYDSLTDGGMKGNDKGYVLVQGRNAHTGTGQELLADPEVRRSFLGG